MLYVEEHFEQKNKVNYFIFLKSYKRITEVRISLISKADVNRLQED